MKKRGLLLMMAVMITALVSAQQKSAEEVFKAYAGKGNCTVLTIPKGAIRLAASLQEEDEPEVKEFLEGISSVKILAVDGRGNQALFGDVVRTLSKNYEELMTVDKGDEQVKFLMRQEGDVIKELLLLTGEEDESAMIIVRGEIRMKDLARMKRSTAHGGGLAFLGTMIDER
jgi:hypothetical protein